MAELQPSAINQLQKLGVLIKRNPKSTFTVEGYTDSFGPPDYNLELSEQRAASVKRYLVEVMGINPDQVETHGYGQAKFIVPPHFMPPDASQVEVDAEIARQQPNRRVVIVVHTNEGGGRQRLPSRRPGQGSDNPERLGHPRRRSGGPLAAEFVSTATGSRRSF